MATVTQVQFVLDTTVMGRPRASHAPSPCPRSEGGRTPTDAIADDQRRVVGGAQLTSDAARTAPADRMPPWASFAVVLAYQLLINTGMAIIYPTALSYSEQLGAGASFSGVMVAVLPFTAMLGTLPLQKIMDCLPLKFVFFVNSAVSVLANVLYACAGLTHSKYTLLVSRVLMGWCYQNSPCFVYITRTVGLNHRSWAMMTLAAVMGAGYAIGPFLAFMTGIFCKELRIDNLVLDENTLPGWLMAFLWFVLLVLQPFLYLEPSEDRGVESVTLVKQEAVRRETARTERPKTWAITFLLFLQIVGGHDVCVVGSVRSDLLHKILGVVRFKCRALHGMRDGSSPRGLCALRYTCVRPDCGPEGASVLLCRGHSCNYLVF